MKIKDPNALAKCQKTIAGLMKKGIGLPEAKRAIARMLAAQSNENRRTLSLQVLDRFLGVLPAVTMSSKSLAYEIGREIDRRAKILRRREMRNAH